MELLLEKSLEVRPVTLSSGKTSNFYMDCKRVTLSPEGAYLTARLMMDIASESLRASLRYAATLAGYRLQRRSVINASEASTVRLGPV